MSRFFLRRLRVEGFRGINNQATPLALDFQTGGVNSVYAVNGYGKSSVFDALQYAITGVVAKLDRMSAAEEPERYYNNLFHTGNASIELTLAPDDGSPDVVIAVERDPAGVRTATSPSGHADPEQLLKSLASDLVLLDYSTFQRFIDHSPLNRGRSFASLVGLGHLSELRQALEVLANTGTVRRDFGLDTLATSITQITDRGRQASARLRQSYEALLGRPPTEPLNDATIGQDVLGALRAITLLQPLITGNTLENIDFHVLDAEIARTEGANLRTELASILTKVAELNGLASQEAATELTEQATIRAAIGNRDQALDQTRGTEFHRLADAASRFLRSGRWTDAHRCPLCDSEVGDAISHIVEVHLRQYQAAADEQTRIGQAWATATWGTRLASCEASQSMAIPLANRVVGRLGPKFEAGTVTAAELDQAVAALRSADAARQEKVTALIARKDAIERQLPPSLVALTRQVQHAKDIRQALQERGTCRTEYAALKQRQTRREAWQQFVTEAANRAATLESTVSEGRTQRIKTQCLSLFDGIMCRPPIRPALTRPEETEDLHLQLEQFYDLNDLSATALLSESYRNAFAISIFLSAMLEARPTARFVVLDDVTSSFDAGHQWWLMEILRTRVCCPNNANGPQVIVLSHDSLLEKYFDRLGNTDGWHHQKLQGSPPQGVLFGQTQAVTRIRDQAEQLLRAGQVDQGQPLVRQYLEYMLQQIIRKVSIRVPIDFVIRDNTRMVGPCIDAIQSDVRLHKAAGALALSAQQERDLDTVHAPAIIGNWVSHYETGGAGAVAPAVLLGVVNSIELLADCFKYDCRCGGGIQRRWYKSLADRACPCR